MENKESSIFDSTNLIVFLLDWMKPLIIITVLATAGSIAVALIITPKFRSTVIMFPASTNSVSKALLTENANGKHDILAFGEEEEAEQMLQILNSDHIRNRICEKYDLLNHYEIDSSEKYVQTKLIEEFEDNIGFKRTQYQSVRIDVLDVDPKYAMNIANDIAALVDSVKNSMQKQRSIRGLEIVKYEYSEVLDYVKGIEDSMTVLRGLGVNEYEVQIEKYTEQYSLAIVQGKKAAADFLQQKLDTLGKYGSAYVSLRNKLEYETERMIELRMKLKQARADAEAEMPHKFIVNNAFEAEKKAYPIRWLIVVVSVISTFLMSIVVIVTIDAIKRAQQKRSAQ